MKKQKLTKSALIGVAVAGSTLVMAQSDLGPAENGIDGFDHATINPPMLLDLSRGEAGLLDSGWQEAGDGVFTKQQAVTRYELRVGKAANEALLEHIGNQLTNAAEELSVKEEKRLLEVQQTLAFDAMVPAKSDYEYFTSWAGGQVSFRHDYFFSNITETSALASANFVQTFGPFNPNRVYSWASVKVCSAPGSNLCATANDSDSQAPAFDLTSSATTGFAPTFYCAGSASTFLFSNSPGYPSTVSLHSVSQPSDC